MTHKLFLLISLAALALALACTGREPTETLVPMPTPTSAPTLTSTPASTPTTTPKSAPTATVTPTIMPIAAPTAMRTATPAATSTAIPAATPTLTSPLPVPELREDSWVQVNGPYGGYITDLEKTEDALWVATSFTNGLGSNGVFEIRNSGLEWLARGGSDASIRDIAVDPSDANNVAFIANPGPGKLPGLFLTQNGGEDWHQVDMDVSIFTAVTMSQASPSVVFVGVGIENEAFVFTSKDQGKTWTKSSPLPEVEWSVRPLWAGFSDAQRNWINVIEPHPIKEETLLVGTNSALFKSEDGGQSWNRVDSTFHRTDVMDIAIDPQTPNEVYVRIGVFYDVTCTEIFQSRDLKLEKEKCAGVYWSPDLGDSWLHLDAYYADPEEGGIFVDEHDPKIAYAIFARLILKTEDGGRTWKEFFWTHDDAYIPNIGLERLVVGEDSSELFIAGRGGLWYSEDGGLHWQDRNAGFIGSEVLDIVKASDGTIYAGTSLGMFRSTDGGANWIFASYQLEDPYAMLLATDPTDPETIYLTTGGGVYASRDGALTWELVAEEFFGWSKIGRGTSFSHYHGIAIDPTEPNRLYVGGGGDHYTPAGAGVSISEDGGRTWKKANVGFQTDVHVSKIVVNSYNPSIVYVTTQGPTEFLDKTGPGHGVFKTSDYGATWEKVNNGLETVETNTLALDPNDPQALYLGTDDDGMYKSSDGGSSWNKILIPLLPERYGVGDIVVDPGDSDVIYVATVDYFRLFHERGLVGDHGIYVSRDGGATWQSFNEGLRHLGIFSLELDPGRGILYAGTRGGGIYWREVN